MSTTKRHIDSLPKEQQDDILGAPPYDEEKWPNSVEDEPTQEQINEWMRQRVDAEELWWAEELAKEEE